MYFIGINIFGSLTCESLHVSLRASQWRCVHAGFYAGVFMRHIHFHSFIAGFPVSLPVLDYRLIGFPFIIIIIIIHSVAYCGRRF